MIARCQKYGFSLIELLTVMAIIIAMGSLAVGAYFAMMRGTGVRSSVGHLRSTLLAARQRAVLNNKPVYVVFGKDSSDTNIMWYVVVEQVGKLTYASGINIGDEYHNMSMYSNGAPIFNMSKSAVPSAIVKNVYPPGTMGPYWAAELDKAIFSEGNRYGIPVSATNTLPRGFLFGNGSYEIPDPVAFGPDGTLRNIGSSFDIKSSPQTISIFEIVNPTKIFKVKVNGPSGLIDVIFPY